MNKKQDTYGRYESVDRESLDGKKDVLSHKNAPPRATWAP